MITRYRVSPEGSIAQLRSELNRQFSDLSTRLQALEQTLRRPSPVSIPSPSKKGSSSDSRPTVFEGPVEFHDTVTFNQSAGDESEQVVYPVTHLGQLPDDPLSGRFAVANIDPNRLALIDFSQSGHQNKILDNINDGSAYLRGIQYEGGSIIVPNGNFEASTSIPPPGWILSNATASYETTSPYSGSQSLKLVTSGTGAGAFTTRRWQVVPGDQFKIRAALKSDGVATAGVMILCFTANGTFNGNIATVQTTNTSWQLLTATGTIPANTAYITIGCEQTTASNGTIWFDNITCTRLRVMDDEIQDGSTFIRTFPQNQTYHWTFGPLSSTSIGTGITTIYTSPVISLPIKGLLVFTFGATFNSGANAAKASFWLRICDNTGSGVLEDNLALVGINQGTATTAIDARASSAISNFVYGPGTTDPQIVLKVVGEASATGGTFAAMPTWIPSSGNPNIVNMYSLPFGQ